MNRRVTEWLKIPESIRIPYFGSRWNLFLTKLDNQAIAKERVQETPLNTTKRTETVTLSLTSFPARIATVYLAIKSLMNQSFKADRIVLWLAESQFPDHVLPEQLLALTAHGLEIRYCEDDLLGHKKHYMAIKEQKPNELVITYDDDIIYPMDSVERLIKVHAQFPDCVVCNRAQAITYLPNCEVQNPGRWKTISDVGVLSPTWKLLPSNGGGVLYPYHALSSDSYDVEKIKKLCLQADDLWMMFMALQNGTKTVKTRKYHRTFSVIYDSQKQQLATENIVNNAYMMFLRNLKVEYPEAWKIVENDGVN